MIELFNCQKLTSISYYHFSKGCCGIAGLTGGKVTVLFRRATFHVKLFFTLVKINKFFVHYAGLKSRTNLRGLGSSFG